MSLQPGMLLGSNLRLVRQLGAGGMGAVWVADHLTLRSQVAVKFVLAPLQADPSVLARFSREATSAAQLRHPHVIQVFDHGITSDGIPYIVMELLEGEDLAHRILREGRLSPVITSLIVAQTAKALGRAHQAGIVHRDVKPENIFLTQIDGETFVKVLDFGIAKDSGPDARQMTGSGALVGTPYTMSPEQAMSSKHVDNRADLWSLAVVAYHCLTGERPFTADAIGGLFIAIAACKFNPPTQLRPDLPPSIDLWFARALHRNIDARFSSAKELYESFDAALRGAAPESAPVRTGTPEATATTAPTITPATPEPAPSLGGTSRSHASLSRSRSRPILAVGAVAAVGLIALVGLLLLRPSQTDPTVGTGSPLAPASESAAPANIAPASPPSLSASAAPESSSSAAPLTTAAVPSPQVRGSSPSAGPRTPPPKPRPSQAPPASPVPKEEDFGF